MVSSDSKDRHQGTEDIKNPLVAFKAFTDQHLTRLFQGLNIDTTARRKDDIKSLDDQAAYAKGFQAGLEASQRGIKRDGGEPSPIGDPTLREKSEQQRLAVEADSGDLSHTLFDILREQHSSSALEDGGQRKLRSSNAVNEPSHPWHAQPDRGEWQDCGPLPFFKALTRPPWGSPMKSCADRSFDADSDTPSSHTIADRPGPAGAIRQNDRVCHLYDDPALLGGQVWALFDRWYREPSDKPEHIYSDDRLRRPDLERQSVDEEEITDLTLFERLFRTPLDGVFPSPPTVQSVSSKQNREQYASPTVPTSTHKEPTSQYESASTATIRQTLEDGSIRTKIITTRRFGNGQEEITKSEHVFPSPQRAKSDNAGQTVVTDMPEEDSAGSHVAAPAKKKGWFWS